MQMTVDEGWHDGILHTYSNGSDYNDFNIFRTEAEMIDIH